jgi:hypothetical protein
MSKSIPPQCVWKADQWMVLTRSHAWSTCTVVKEITESVQSHVQLWHAFRKVRASDEMYIPTVMSLLGLIQPCWDTSELNPDLGKAIWNRRVTYCDWSLNLKNPETFPIERRSEFQDVRRVLTIARKEGCLFARKFSMERSDEISGEEWMQMISSINDV